MDKNYKNLIFKYTFGEELANSITHGIGLLFSIYGMVILIKQALIHNSISHLICFSIYGSSLILLYLASTLYHSFTKPSFKLFFKKFDHAAIYLLIAGTYTPFIILSIKSPAGFCVLATSWLLAILGVILKFVCISKYEKLSLFIYLFMGWLCVIAGRDIITNMSSYSLIMLVIGGIFYTGGVLFYVWQNLPYNHGIWHIFVLCGSLFHYLSIFDNSLIA